MRSSQSRNRSRHEAYRPELTSTRPELTSMAVRDAILTAIGTLALASIAVVHLVQLVPTFKATPLLGAAFVLLIAGAVTLAVRLVVRTDSTTWSAIGLLSVGAIAGYVLTRLVSTPLDNQDVGNWACMLGIAALFVEITLAALARHAVTIKRSLRVARPSVAATNGQARVSAEPQLESA